MEQLNILLETLVGYVWGIHTVYILVGTGVLLTIFLGVPQIKGFLHAIQVVRGKYDRPEDKGEISHFQALCTALSATVGLGNIAGVAVAIKVGGPGAIFWMVLTGLVGMATKYAECTLAVKYRKIDENGSVHGGPMHYITMGLGEKFKPMAIFFAFACIMASFGAANMFQTNQVAAILGGTFGVNEWVTGIVLSFLTGIVIIGGIKRIGSVTSVLVPVMGGIYVLGSLVVILGNLSVIPEMFGMIFHDAFNGSAAAGGFAGAIFREVLVQGVRRACFSNEAGIGSAPIAHSAAHTDEPAREGVVALLEPFIDTVVICTMTALVIMISGAWTTEATGVELTALAFDSVIPGFGNFFVPVAVFLFAYSTLLSWSYYGERAVDFIFPDSNKALMGYKILFCIFAVVGAVTKIGIVLNFSDLMLGMMIVPNLIAIALLFPKIKEETDSYFSRLKSGEIKAHD